MPDDIELLKDYAETNSEPAFAELVSRHLNLVYSAALRSTGNSHAAQEISQAVFVILAKKANELAERTALSGWLYQTARLTAQNYVRTEMRRQNREQEAYMQSTLTESNPELWRQIAPLLDDAMGRLGESDRNAIVQRFFENKSLRDVGAALGATEEAAKMRVNRALEKLRKIFARRGLNSTTTAIAENISRHSIQVAPVGLAKMITAVAVAKGATASVSTLTLIKGALKIMAWTKMKTAVIAGVAAIVAISATTVAVKTVEHHNANRLETYFTKMDSNYLDTAPPTVLVRPSKYADQGNYVIGANKNGGKLMRRGTSFSELLTTAYGFGPEQMILPSNLPKGQFDMLLTVPGNQKQALQEALKKQFGVVAHTETRDTDVMVLKVVQPNAPGLKVSRGGGPNIWTQNGHIKLQGYRISDPSGFDIGHLLGGFYNLPVVDETGLTGKYDVDVQLNSDLEPAAQQKEVESILREQFGLSLTPDKRSMDMLVVEKTK